MIESIFAKRLRQLHEEAGMSHDDLVAHLESETGFKMHQTAYSFYLRGERKPNYIAAAVLCKYFNVSFEWLTGRVDDRRPVPELLNLLASNKESNEENQLLAMLSSLPISQREAITASIIAAASEQKNRRHNDERWQLLSRLIERLDVDGSLKEFVRAEAKRISEDVGSEEPLSELVY